MRRSRTAVRPATVARVVGGPEDMLQERWPAMRPFAVVGAAAVVGGGLVAAVSRPTDFELGSWVAAYLVLVTGVAQAVLGVGQAWISEALPRARHLVAEIVLWNLGTAATIAGSLLPAFAASAAGGACTAAASGLFLLGTCPLRRGPAWRVVAVHRSVSLLILASMPIGLALAWARHT